MPFRLGNSITGHFKTGGKLRWLDRQNDEEQDGRGGLQYGSGAGSLSEPYECISAQIPGWNLEEVIGDLAQGLDIRDRLFYVTKTDIRGQLLGEAGLQQALTRMKTDMIDAMLVHNIVAADTELPLMREWQRTLHAAGWAGVSWPKEYGGRGATLMPVLFFLAVAMLSCALAAAQQEPAQPQPDASDPKVPKAVVEMPGLRLDREARLIDLDATVIRRRAATGTRTTRKASRRIPRIESDYWTVSVPVMPRWR